MRWCPSLLDYAKIRQLVQSNDADERLEAINQIRDNFKNFTDTNKEQSWKDLFTLAKDEINSVQEGAVSALDHVFQYVIDKERATKYLLALTKDKDISVRKEAANVLGTVFAHVTDKEQATKDLLILTKDDYSFVRCDAAQALGSAFTHITDKKQATKDLLALTKDEENNVRFFAAYALDPVFAHITDKKQATKDLLALTEDEENDVRMIAVYVLGSAFAHITDKKQATKYLRALTKDENGDVRWLAADALGSAFAYVTDKEQVWKDLFVMTEDENENARRDAIQALGSAFVYVTDKEQAMIDLLTLTTADDRIVRASANHSLGKVSIYRATEAENKNKLKEELEKAIVYFEKSSQESTVIDSAKFCLPFYRSYYAVIFRQYETKEEIAKNLEDAKQAVEGSESKEKLLEAVENLGNALQEAQKLRGLDEIKTDLNAYRRYCDRTVELLDETKDKAPGAAMLVRRGLPIIDEQIKAILVEIQEKTEELCKETVDTPLEDLGKEVNKIGQGLLLVRDPIGLEKSVGNLEFALSDICNRMGGKDKGEACKLLEKSKNEQYVEDKINLINMVLSKIPFSIKEETEHEKSNGDIFNINADQITVTTNKNSKISKQNSGIMNRIHTESTRKIIEILGISFTIAGVIWGISYAILIEIEYPTAMKDSLIVFIFTFLLSSFISARKK